MATMRELELNSGMRCVKVMLLIVTFMFALTAILLMLVGTTIQLIFTDFRIFIDDHFLSPPNLLIAIGFIMLFVASLGAYGVFKESVLMVNVFGVFLFIVFILEVSAAIATFVMQGEIDEMLVRTMNQTFSEYENTEEYPYIETVIDSMQRDLECCGVDGPADWKIYWSKNQNLTSEEIFDNKIYVPRSCCGDFSLNDDMQCEYKYQYGCLHRLNYIISQSTMLIATGATTVAFIQLLCVLCAFMLAKTLRRNKSLRAARRSQLQESLGIIISGGKMLPPPNSMSGYTQLEKQEHLHFPETEPITYTPNSPSVN